MKLSDFETILRASGDAPVSFVLPDGSAVPPHFHLTEVGYVRKEFVDCGGVRRTDEYCALQLWVASDVDHQLKASKVVSILDHTQSVIPCRDLDVQVEYQRDSLSVYRVASADRLLGKLVVRLESKATACLAPDQCGVSGCC